MSTTHLLRTQAGLTASPAVAGNPAAVPEPTATLQEVVAELCAEVQFLAYATAEARVLKCRALQGKIDWLLACPDLKAGSAVAVETKALAVFLEALCAHPMDISEANLRTVALAADVLHALFLGVGAVPETAGSRFSAVLLDARDDSRAAVGAALAETGFEVVSFASPAETLAHLESHPADLVVVDVPVPVPVGFDVSKKIGKLALHEQTPVLVALSTQTTHPGTGHLVRTELVLKALSLVHKSRLSASRPEVLPITTTEDPLTPDLLGALDGQPSAVGDGAQALPESAAASSASATEATEPAVPTASAARAAAPEGGVHPPSTGAPETASWRNSRLLSLSNRSEPPKPVQKASAVEPAVSDLLVRLDAETQERQRLEKQLRDLLAAQGQTRPKAETPSRGQGEAASGEQPGASRGPEPELAELERRIREGIAALARTTVALERERGQRQRAEERAAASASQLRQLHDQLGRQLEAERAAQERITELERALRDRDDKLARAVADLEKEAADRRRLEDQCRLADDLRGRLEANQDLLEKARKTFQGTLTELEEQLLASRNALAASESRRETETKERQRLEEALAGLQRQLQVQAEDHRVAASKHQSALQAGELERQRLEAEILHCRRAMASSAHTDRALLDRLRRQLQPPVEELRQSACALLQTELVPGQKQAVETMLELTLLIQTSLQSGALVKPEARCPADNAGPEAAPGPDPEAGRKAEAGPERKPASAEAARQE